jgi:hypothetical protein
MFEPCTGETETRATVRNDRARVGTDSLQATGMCVCVWQ